MLLCLLQECLFFLGYVTGKSEFPKPLSKKEEAAVIDRYAQGDEEARRLLIEHNLRLVSHIAKKYYAGGAQEQDDLVSIGTIGLIKAVDSFDHARANRFSTYAARCVENGILSPATFCRKHRPFAPQKHPAGTS